MVTAWFVADLIVYAFAKAVVAVSGGIGVVAVPVAPAQTRTARDTARSPLFPLTPASMH